MAKVDNDMKEQVLLLGSCSKKLISAIVCLKEPQNIEQKIQTCLIVFVKCPSPQYGIVSTFLSACPYFYPQYSARHVKVGKCIFSLQSVQIFAGKYGTGGQGTRAFPLHLHICSGRTFAEWEN